MSDSPTAPGLRVFIVENHEDTRVTLTLLLTHLGHQVCTATSLREALALLPSADPDVLVSDIGLPDGNGWELMARAHLPKRIYAIAMSGYGMESDRERSAIAGFRHHLTKPIDLDLLERLLGEAASERASRERG